jgi:hypothetical protein
MIIEEVGGKPIVIGSNMAIVPETPIPGRTPMSVPTETPTKQNNTFAGVKAT